MVTLLSYDTPHTVDRQAFVYYEYDLVYNTHFTSKRRYVFYDHIHISTRSFLLSTPSTTTVPTSMCSNHPPRSQQTSRAHYTASRPTNPGNKTEAHSLSRGQGLADAAPPFLADHYHTHLTPPTRQQHRTGETTASDFPNLTIIALDVAPRSP